MTADGARPWWASEDAEVDGLDPDEDPIAAVRRARAADDPGPGSSSQDARHDPPCGVCPLCLGWQHLDIHHPEVAEHLAAAGRHLLDAQPEVAAHLSAAGRHLSAALRHLVDERGATGTPEDDGVGADTANADGASPRGARSARAGERRSGLERIHLDDEEDVDG